MVYPARVSVFSNGNRRGCSQRITSPAVFRRPLLFHFPRYPIAMLGMPEVHPHPMAILSIYWSNPFLNLLTQFASTISCDSECQKSTGFVLSVLSWCSTIFIKFFYYSIEWTEVLPSPYPLYSWLHNTSSCFSLAFSFHCRRLPTLLVCPHKLNPLFISVALRATWCNTECQDIFKDFESFSANSGIQLPYWWKENWRFSYYQSDSCFSS